LAQKLKKRDSDLTSFDANPLASKKEKATAELGGLFGLGV